LITTSAKIVVLEVESSLNEPIAVSDIVNAVDDVECVDSGCMPICPNSRVLSYVVDVFEDLATLALARSPTIDGRSGIVSARNQFG